MRTPGHRLLIRHSRMRVPLARLSSSMLGSRYSSSSFSTGSDRISALYGHFSSHSMEHISSRIGAAQRDALGRRGVDNPRVRRTNAFSCKSLGSVQGFPARGIRTAVHRQLTLHLVCRKRRTSGIDVVNVQSVCCSSGRTS